LKLIAKTLEGLEEVLAQEIIDLGGENVEIIKRAVIFNGNKVQLYKSNLWLRTCLKVLVFLKEIYIKNENDLYNEVKKIAWEDYFTADETFAIDSVVNSSIFRHSNFASLKAKDAIVDRFREKYGYRPNVDTADPHIKINIHIRENTLTLSLDSSGNSLHLRGYRKAQVDAPLNEVLAAGLVYLSGWDKKSPLTDPMCGSGTILCEAARLAGQIPPQSLGRDFAFKKWKSFDADLYSDIIKEAESGINYGDIPSLNGFDMSPKAVKAAETNIECAGLQNYIQIEELDFFYQDKAEGITLIFNPPYDGRLKELDINNTYKQIGDKLKMNFENCTAWILSGHLDAMKNVGLKPSARKKLLNGSIESIFCKYEMYKGSKKQKWAQKYG